jgi:hypothetical protein
MLPCSRERGGELWPVFVIVLAALGLGERRDDVEAFRFGEPSQGSFLCIKPEAGPPLLGGGYPDVPDCLAH